MGSERQKSVRGHVLDAVGSLLTCLLVFAATPTVLISVVGYPLGGGLGHQWNHAARVALTGVTLVAWVAWLACCTQLTRSVIAQVRQGHVSAPAGGLLTDRVAARIAAGVLSLIAIAAPPFVASGAGASSDHLATSAIGIDVPPPTSWHSPALPTAVVQPSVAATYVVRPDDSLWSIAEAELGDGGDWPAIAALNLGHTMSDGLRFVDPSLIRAGWTLELPDSSGPAVPPTAPGTGAVELGAPAPPSPAPPSTGAPRARVFDHGTARHVPTFPEATALVAPSGSVDEAGPGRLSLPELSALGIGALACAALARRSRRMRLLRLLTSPDLAPGAERPAAAVDADIVLDRFSGLPALRAFEAANYGLGLPQDQGGPSPRTMIRAICVGPAGTDFWLTEPGQPAPAGFSLSADAKVWHAGHDAFTASTGSGPFLPIVLPVGEDDAGTWLVPLQRGGCLPLIGEASGDLWRAARRAQEAWAWSDMVLITEDPSIVSRELALLDGSDWSTHAPQVLFFGDPASLSDAEGRQVAIVTRSVVSASDVTVLVDRNAASIHPLGRTVRPHLMGAETSAVVDQLVAQPPAVDPVGSRTAIDAEVVTGRVTREGSARPTWRNDPVAAVVAAQDECISLLGPGTVEVRLLTATPRLEGLREPLAPNRARRATELVAYLALHAGDDVTSDRLRTRVLGSSDADAAAKTLFNIATAARRAMGTDPAGVALFPAGSRTGLYRVSEGVSVDVHRAAALATEGGAAKDPDVAMALLRSALSLVEGGPLANALSGYGWWDAEGHGARIAAVLVNAASDLAALAVDAGLFELAQWGLGQARLLDPYSEAISRVAMQVAAAAGDADRLRQEWRECRRRIDELDPGSSPSPRTERLYQELAHRVLVGVTSTAGDQ